MEIKYIKLDEIKINSSYDKLVPKISDKQSAKLESDVTINGITYPIITNKDNEIIDGHNRYRIAQKLQFQTIPAIVKDYSDKLEESADVVVLNYARRQMTHGQKLQAVAFLLSVETDLAKKRMLSGKSNDPTPTLQEGNSSKGEAAKIVADKLDIGRTTVLKVKKIDEIAKINPDFADKLQKYTDGEEKSSIHKLYKEALNIVGKEKEKSGSKSEPKSEETLTGEVPVITELKSNDPTTSASIIEIQPINFGAYLKITDEEAEEDEIDYTEDKRGEDIDFTFKISADVQKRLDFLKGCSTLAGKPIETYNTAIRIALKRANLWDFPEFEK